MNWIGKWKNQYDSIIDITLQQDGKIEGTFESAVDETTKGKKLFLTGVYKDNLIALSCTGGNHVVTYAGMFYEGKMETVWHVVSSDKIVADENNKAVKKELAWWQSVTTNEDTFEKMD